MMIRLSLSLMLAALLLPGFAIAGPDDYIGDTAIYGGETALVKPNVLIIFDTSGSMSGDIATEVCYPDPDTDDDGVNDDVDNCLVVANSDQLDTDLDGIGDACDDNTIWPDSDGDGHADNVDNCPLTPNPGQEDTFGDARGDACENDGSGGYDPDFDYTNGNRIRACGRYQWWLGRYEDRCRMDAIYQCDRDDWDWRTGTCQRWEELLDDGFNSGHRSDDDCDDAIEALESQGQYIGEVRIRNNDCRNSDRNRYFATGNWIAWYVSTAGGTVSTEGPGVYGSIAQTDPGAVLPNDMSTGTPSADYNAPTSPPDAASSSATSAVPGMICETVMKTKNTIARDVVEDIINSTSGVNFGIMQFNGDNGGKIASGNVDGALYKAEIKDMNEIHTGTTTNQEALIELVRNLPADSWTPLAETLFESMRYLKGENSAFQGGVSYDSPITASCQQTYVILITDGMSTKDRASVLTSICDSGDCDDDNNEPGSFSDDGSDYLDDVAKYLHDTDLSTGDDGYAGTQYALTFTIGFGFGGGNASAVQLLEDTAENGGGEAYLAENYQSLTGALTSILGQILEVNSSFVAPVVPTNPENKTFSGKRVYLGFFKPITNNDWYGNLKKFGLSVAGDVVDKNGVVATDVNGRFLSTSTSFWSTNPDGSNVDDGGVGMLLTDRDFGVSPRLIYTYTGTQSDLTHASNRFAKVAVNPALTPAMMEVLTSTESDQIVDYITGFDVYDADGDGDTTERREWLMGDILHSKPTIQAYNSYNMADETDITKNLTTIYVGSNDGQLHAFRDADGAELWSFIPPAALPDLRFLGNNIHNYFIDASPSVYIYDKDRDGNIGPLAETLATDHDLFGVTDNGVDDKIILIFGMRRGGGIDTLNGSLSRGSYFAIDVTNPTAPKYLWEINSTTTGFSELGETWSRMTFAKMRINSIVRLVAFVGAGYDNNEDMRFGNTQLFPDGSDELTESTLRADDATELASPGTSPQFNPRGRGVYVLELATFDASGAPSFHASPVKLWEYVYDSARASTDPDNNPTYSFPTDIVPLDSDFDGLIDRLYAGDTGGSLWRFDVKSTVATSDWSAKKIFSANPSDLDNSVEDPVTNGRRILYPPSVILEADYTGLYFGTGDRAHPLNEGTIDRLYALYDREQTTAKTEADMVNVTIDYLQLSDPPAYTGSCPVDDNSVTCILQRLYSTDKYGWFIKLDQNSGEKALSPAVVFNKVAYFTTYTPNIITDDPCLAGNLGVGRTYAVDYKTGEAVFNFDVTNDDEFASNNNDRAESTQLEGVILRRSDRSLVMASGIPSGVVIYVREDGTTGALIGCGGGLCPSDTLPGGTVIPIYWMQE